MIRMRRITVDYENIHEGFITHYFNGNEFGIAVDKNSNSVMVVEFVCSVSFDIGTMMTQTLSLPKLKKVIYIPMQYVRKFTIEEIEEVSDAETDSSQR